VDRSYHCELSYKVRGNVFAARYQSCDPTGVGPGGYCQPPYRTAFKRAWQPVAKAAGDVPRMLAFRDEIARNLADLNLRRTGANSPPEVGQRLSEDGPETGQRLDRAGRREDAGGTVCVQT
jgi:hypothetical protein